VIVRLRADADLPALDHLVRRTHAERGYPRHLPEDPVGWLVGSASTTDFWVSYVAEHGDELLGHVALASALGDLAEQAWSRALGLPPDRLAVVKRLAVDPAHEGRGIGRALLGRAVTAAHERGRWPVLDTTADNVRAARLYERAGWRDAGEVVVPAGRAGWQDSAVLRCFVGPPPG
jgi:GNAT superfamily N-acetyltransferase